MTPRPMTQRSMMQSSMMQSSMIMRRALTAVLVVMLSTIAAAQAHRASIRGRVTDAAGRAVNSAQVTATHQETNEKRAVTSDESGAFAIPELPPGSYRVVIEAGGHRMHVEELTLEVN